LETKKKTEHKGQKWSGGKDFEKIFANGRVGSYSFFCTGSSRSL
jgi:hypothetical protein